MGRFNGDQRDDHVHGETYFTIGMCTRPLHLVHDHATGATIGAGRWFMHSRYGFRRNVAINERFREGSLDSLQRVTSKKRLGP